MWKSVLKSGASLCVKKYRSMSQTKVAALTSPVRLFLPDAPELQDPRCWSWCRSRSWSWAQSRNPWSAGKQQVQFCLTRTVISSLSDREEGHAQPKTWLRHLEGGLSEEEVRWGKRGGAFSVECCVQSKSQPGVDPSFPDNKGGEIYMWSNIQMWLIDR